jgi:hypothetical protein
MIKVLLDFLLTWHFANYFIKALTRGVWNFYIIRFAIPEFNIKAGGFSIDCNFESLTNGLIIASKLNLAFTISTNFEINYCKHDFILGM